MKDLNYYEILEIKEVPKKPVPVIFAKRNEITLFIVKETDFKGFRAPINNLISWMQNYCKSSYPCFGYINSDVDINNDINMDYDINIEEDDF